MAAVVSGLFRRSEPRTFGYDLIRDFGHPDGQYNCQVNSGRQAAPSY